MTPIELRHNLQLTKQAFGRGEATVDDLYAAADKYIAALREFKKRTKAKINIPSRSYIIRAI